MKKKSLLYGNKPIWYNPVTKEAFEFTELLTSRERNIRAKELKKDGFIFFPSRLEHEFFLYLRDFLTLESIVLHPKVILIPRNPSLEIDEISWKIDFYLQNTDSARNLIKNIYCETKGFETPDFKVKYSLFRHFNVGEILLIRSTRDFKNIQQFLK